VRSAGLIALVALLALPSSASANHVPSATYEGEVTTGQFGDVTLTVSEDGSTVDASFTGMGSQNGMCTGVGFSTGPVPITNHSFSYLSPNGQVSASGTFGPSSVDGGAQVLTDPCTTGSQAWRVVGPDGFFETDVPGNFLGLEVFEPSGAGQTQEHKVKQGATGPVPFQIGNFGQSSASFLLKGCKSSKGFKVKYSDESGDVTNEVVDGSYETESLAPAEIAADTQEHTLKVKVAKDAKPGKTKSCKIEAASDILVDVIKAKVKVKMA
jgi:hypothetical protein